MATVYGRSEWKQRLRDATATGANVTSKTARVVRDQAVRTGGATWEWATTPQVVVATCRNCSEQTEIALRGAPDRVVQGAAALVVGSVGAAIGATIGIATGGTGIAATIPGAIVGGEAGRKSAAVTLRRIHRHTFVCHACGSPLDDGYGRRGHTDDTAPPTSD